MAAAAAADGAPDGAALARLAAMAPWRVQLLEDRLALYREDIAAWLSGARVAVDSCVWAHR
jgi:hypothetical protein